MTTIFEAIKFIESIVEEKNVSAIVIVKTENEIRFSYFDHYLQWQMGKIIDNQVTLTMENGDTLCTMPLNKTIFSEWQDWIVPPSER